MKRALRGGQCASPVPPSAGEFDTPAREGTKSTKLAGATLQQSGAQGGGCIVPTRAPRPRTPKALETGTTTARRCSQGN